nr:EAL domain-containing protein [Sphingobium sp. Sx8-8]
MAKAVYLLDSVAGAQASLVWQPTVGSAPDAPIFYYEGLLRIHDGAGNLRSAEPEILALERVDLSPELDRRLMSAALDELEANPTLCLGINISSASASLHRYGTNTLWRELRERLNRRSGLAGRLVIEITETAQFVSLEEAREFISVMQELGCLVAVDDFGTGGRSIFQLSALAADIVKIDSRFVRDASNSDEGYGKFLDLVRLGTSFASAVIVEGIETADQASLARNAGAGWLQGYQFGRPSAGPMLPVVRDARIIASRSSTAGPGSAEEAAAIRPGRLD